LDLSESDSSQANAYFSHSDILEGVAFALNNGQFQAYGYERCSPLNLSEEFLEDLRDILVRNKLHDYIALSKLDKEHEKLMEQCEGRSHVCNVTDDETSPEEVTG
jgi:hypothetical protein